MRKIETVITYKDYYIRPIKNKTLNRTEFIVYKGKEVLGVYPTKVDAYKAIDGIKEEYNRLLKVRIFVEGPNQFSLRPEEDRQGDLVAQRGEIRFRGTDQEFAKFLRKIKAKDNSSDPPSTKKTRYIDMVNSAKDGTDPYIWVWTKYWKPFLRIILTEEGNWVDIFLIYDPIQDDYYLKSGKYESQRMDDIDIIDFLGEFDIRTDTLNKDYKKMIVGAINDPEYPHRLKIDKRQFINMLRRR
jgi:hypothetical protein